MKRNTKLGIERKKKGISGSNQIMLIHSNVHNRTILFHSNVSKLFFRNNTLTRCPGCSLDESSNSMNKKSFLKKLKVTRLVKILFPLTTTEE